MCGSLIRGGMLSTWRCHPYFSWKNWRSLFSHHRLWPVSSAMLPIFIFPWKTDDLFWWSKFAGALVGPLFVGPLFGRTCWACLNPPLRRRMFRGFKSMGEYGIYKGLVAFPSIGVSKQCFRKKIFFLLNINANKLCRIARHHRRYIANNRPSLTKMQ